MIGEAPGARQKRVHSQISGLEISTPSVRWREMLINHRAADGGQRAHRARVAAVRILPNQIKRVKRIVFVLFPAAVIN